MEKRKRPTLEQKRAVVLEPGQKTAVTLVQQLNALRNAKELKRRAQQERRREVVPCNIVARFRMCLMISACQEEISSQSQMVCTRNILRGWEKWRLGGRGTTKRRRRSAMLLPGLPRSRRANGSERNDQKMHAKACRCTCTAYEFLQRMYREEDNCNAMYKQRSHAACCKLWTACPACWVRTVVNIAFAGIAMGPNCPRSRHDDRQQQLDQCSFLLIPS